MADELAQVIRLRPVRTLVVARDLAFRQRAVTVLGDLGVVAFAVIALDDPEKVVELIRHERADVVVLDATGCGPAVAGVVYELSRVAPRVGVVLVAASGDRSQRLPVVDKWGWAEELARAVQQAYHRGNPLGEDSADADQHPC